MIQKYFPMTNGWNNDSPSPSSHRHWLSSSRNQHQSYCHGFPCNCPFWIAAPRTSCQYHNRQSAPLWRGNRMYPHWVRPTMCLDFVHSFRSQNYIIEFNQKHSKQLLHQHTKVWKNNGLCIRHKYWIFDRGTDDEFINCKWIRTKLRCLWFWLRDYVCFLSLSLRFWWQLTYQLRIEAFSLWLTKNIFCFVSVELSFTRLISLNRYVKGILIEINWKQSTKIPFYSTKSDNSISSDSDDWYVRVPNVTSVEYERTFTGDILSMENLEMYKRSVCTTQWYLYATVMLLRSIYVCDSNGRKERTAWLVSKHLACVN